MEVFLQNCQMATTTISHRWEVNFSLILSLILELVVNTGLLKILWMMGVPEVSVVYQENMTGY